MPGPGDTRGLGFHSLRFRLLVLVVVAVVPGAVASLVVGYQYRHRELARIEEDTRAFVRLAASDQEDLLTRTTPPLLRVLATLHPEVRAGDAPRMSALFARMLGEYPQYINIMAADATTGDVVASGVPLERPLNLADRAYFPEIVGTRRYVIGEFAVGKRTGRPTLTAGHPVLGADGSVRFVVVAGIDVERLAHEVAASQPNKDTVITMLDRNGTVLFSSRAHGSQVGRSVADADLWRVIGSADGREGFERGPGLDGVDSLIAFRPLVGDSGKRDGWVVASIAAETALAPADRFLGKLLLGTLLGTGLALAGGLVVGQRSIVKNVDALVGTAERLAQGNLGVTTGAAIRTEEFARLAQAFDGMSQKLLDREDAQKLAERALFEEKELLRVTLRSIGDGVITTDGAGRVTMLNTVAEELTGWTQAEAAGRPLSEIFHIVHEKTRERAVNPVERVLQTGGIVQLANHTALVTRDGRERVIADSGAPIRGAGDAIVGVVLVFRDITERQRLEDEAIKAERLESLGVLAGGVAHDFNNLLTAILGNVSVASRDAQTGGDLGELLSNAQNAALRARDLTRQLLAFSTGAILQKRTVAMQKLVQETTRFVLSGTNVRCDFDVQDGLWDVDIDEGQISQVLNNLLLNAVQAMQANGEGGAMALRAENRALEAGSAVPLPPGRYVRIEIRDEGHGIPHEHLERIFDPYFTTKRGGLGLGLSSAYYIVKRHDGHIGVRSAPGAGTTFTIHLPASEGVAAEPAARRALFKGTGKVLVMDDEEMVRRVAGRMLSRLGFEVEHAADGREAVEKYRAALARGAPPVFALLDLTIPGGMGGKDAAAAIRALDGTARLFASSGYSQEAALSELRAHGFCGVIPKPYLLEDVERALEEVLAPSGPQPELA